MASGRASTRPGTADAPRRALASGDTDAVQVTGVHAVPFFAGVGPLLGVRSAKAEERADLLTMPSASAAHSAWEENLGHRRRPWTDSAFAVFGLDLRHACDQPPRPAQLRDRRGPRAVRRFASRCCTGASRPCGVAGS